MRSSLYHYQSFHPLYPVPHSPPNLIRPSHLNIFCCCFFHSEASTHFLLATTTTAKKKNNSLARVLSATSSPSYLFFFTLKTTTYLPSLPFTSHSLLSKASRGFYVSAIAGFELWRFRVFRGFFEVLQSRQWRKLQLER